jgi:DNA-binding transcriptional ArsR family regulator
MTHTQHMVETEPDRRRPPLRGPANVAAVAALVADPARAAMLDALMDGSAHRAGELAERAGVAPSTASGHLARLLDGGLVTCEATGRERCYRLASVAIAEALETLARLARPLEVRSLRAADAGEAIRAARTCYDHLAGRLGVGLTEALVEREVLACRDSAYELTAAGEATLVALGVDVARARSHRRSFARACLDWSERRPHLAGALGAALAEALLAQGWLQPRPHDRGLVVTHDGVVGLRRFGVELS